MLIYTLPVSSSRKALKESKDGCLRGARGQVEEIQVTTTQREQR